VRSTAALLVLLLAPACASHPADAPGRRAIPVYEEVEVPVCERRPEPRVAIRFIPKYEIHVDPALGEGRGPRCEGEDVQGRVGEKRRRVFVGYEPEEVPIGCSWKTVQTGTETIRRLKGWRWADDPPWPCEVEARARRAAEEEASRETSSSEEDAASGAMPEVAPRRERRAASPGQVEVEDLPSLEDL
jgi:hypothetical protein